MLEPLHLKLTGSAEGLTAAIGKAQGSVGGFGMSVDGFAKGFTGKLSGLVAAFNPVTAAIAVGFAAITAAATGAAIAIGNVRAAMDRVDEANDAANKLGVGFTERAQLQLSLSEATGADSGTIDSAIVKLQTTLGEAAKEGSGKAFEALQKLGLDAGELLAAGPMKQIEMIAERVSGLNDKSAQTSIIFDLLGRQGMAIAAAFRNSPEGLREAAAWAEKNLSLTQQQVEQIGMANDVWGRVGDKIGAIWNQIAADLAPAFQMVGEDVLYWVEQLGNAGIEVSNLSDAFAVVYGIATDVAEVFQAIGSTLYETWAAGVRIITEFTTALIESLGIVDLINESLAMIGVSWDSLVNSIASLLPMDAIEQVFGKEATERMRKNWESAVNFDGVSKSLERLRQIREEAMGKDRSGIPDAMAEALERGGTAIESAAERAKESLRETQSNYDKISNGMREQSPLKAITDRAEQIRVVAERDAKKQNDAALEKLRKELVDQQKKTNELLKEIKDQGRELPPIDLD